MNFFVGFITCYVKLSLFRFLDVRNSISPILSFGKWVKAIESKIDKLVCHYKYVDRYDK